ncbi:cell cycle checkpoint control protein RAD9A [Danaus plexippus]|uniref:cell cycle checkpoint control protein RAD9A n=1 Tax=Danaus plexippus TaxID=13037 RepID=UPI002AAFC821|nr:cell cycle checkpoint control protein RAD9A [Danaus plexippus]
MKCHVPGPNVKVLARTVHALARFGDELYLESLPDCILLRTLNASESAYAMVKLNKNFFSHFNYNYYSIENDGLKCKISMKSALNAFKSPAHMDKQVENLEIKLDPHSSKLIFQLKCKHGIVKTHYVSILDCKAMQAIYTKDLVPNRITSSQRLFSEAIGNFQCSDDQVTLEVTSESLIIKNFGDTPTDLSRIIRSQVTIKPFEFSSYTIGTDTNITFTMKEFRALLGFAEGLNLPVQLHFEITGKPAVFIVHNGTTIEAHFVLATSKPDIATQYTSQQTTNSERKRKDDSNDNNISAKKAHLEEDLLNQFQEDSNLFNYIPNNISQNVIENINNLEKADSIDTNRDNIPASPTSKMKIASVFKRCFESTFDPRIIHGVVLAENSDSD